VQTENPFVVGAYLDLILEVLKIMNMALQYAFLLYVFNTSPFSGVAISGSVTLILFKPGISTLNFTAGSASISAHSILETLRVRIVI